MDRPPFAKRLFGDKSGAVMLAGVVMGALLVGALWHLASIGNAILWRERAQDAADAAAFENAVWNARGMNLLVALNLIMQVTLAILVVWRIGLIIAGFLVVAAGFICGLTVVVGGEGCILEEQAIQLAKDMKDIDKELSYVVMRILGAMRIAQFMVSEATPGLAHHFAGPHTKDAYPALTGATTWSASLLPSLNTKVITDVSRCFLGKSEKLPNEDPSKFEKMVDAYKKGLGVYNDWAGEPRLSVPFSLPVSAGSYATLCGKAGELIPVAVGKLVGLMGAHLPAKGIALASKYLGDVTKSAPSVFCMPMTGTEPLKDAMKDLTQQAEQQCTSDLEHGEAVLAPGSDPKNPKYQPYKGAKGKPVGRDDWLKACKKDRLDEANKKLTQAVKDDTADASSCGKPVSIWALASNGNVFLRSFSSVTQAETTSAHDGHGLDVADGTRTGNVSAIAPGSIGAHAEMYFDCADDGKTKATWSTCSGGAMWSLKWEARLRRVHPLGELASTAVEQLAVETLMKMANKALADTMNEFLHEKLDVPADVVPNVSDIFLWGMLTGDAKKFIYEHSKGSTVDGVRETILRHGGSTSVVH